MAFENNPDKRRFHRIFYNAEAKLEGGGFRYECKIIDLSLKGCLLAFTESWTGSSETDYKMTLGLSEEVEIKMDLRAVHREGKHVGFICRHIDIDSISRLRRLVELNLGDSELLERELAALSLH